MAAAAWSFAAAAAAVAEVGSRTTGVVAGLLADMAAAGCPQMQMLRQQPTATPSTSSSGKRGAARAPPWRSQMAETNDEERLIAVATLLQEMGTTDHGRPSLEARRTDNRKSFGRGRRNTRAAHLDQKRNALQCCVHGGVQRQTSSFLPKPRRRPCSRRAFPRDSHTRTNHYSGLLRPQRYAATPNGPQHMKACFTHLRQSSQQSPPTALALSTQHTQNPVDFSHLSRGLASL